MITIVRNWGFAYLALIMVTSLGCGSGNPWDPVKVSGKVTYEDDSPIPGGMRLYFIPQTPPIDDKTFPRQGGTNVGAEGTFDAVTTYKFGDGLIPGKHKVVVSAGGRGARGKPTVPPEYGAEETTPLEIDTADSPLHIKIRKP